MQTDTRRKEETGVELAIAEHDGGGRKLRLLLHACCGPCLAGVIDRVRPHFDITVFFFNPNILPEDEFIRRFDTLKLLLSHYPDVKLVAPEYDPTPFLTVSEGKTDLPEGGERCLGCFALRLGETARYLAAHGGSAVFGDGQGVIERERGTLFVRAQLQDAVVRDLFDRETDVDKERVFAEGISRAPDERRRARRDERQDHAGGDVERVVIRAHAPHLGELQDVDNERRRDYNYHERGDEMKNYALTIKIPFFHERYYNKARA